MSTFESRPFQNYLIKKIIQIHYLYENIARFCQKIEVEKNTLPEKYAFFIRKIKHPK